MGRLGSGVRFGLACSVALAAGCGSEQFAPPPGLKVATTSESTAPSKTIFLIIPGPPDLDLEYAAMSAQREAGLLKAIFRLAGPAPGEGPTKQGDAIRRAVADGAQALVVYPVDAPETAPALAEAAAKGVAVVLVGRVVAAAAGKPPFTLVVPAPFAASAKQVVATAIADAKKNGRPGDGEALVVAIKKGDAYSADRVAALKAAAESAGCRKVETVAFEGAVDAALPAMLERARAIPDLTLILAEGDEALELAIKARQGLKGSPLAFVGGYAGVHGMFQPNSYERESAFVEFRPENLAKLAIRTAVALAEGGTSEARVELEPRFNRGSGTTIFDPARLERVEPVERTPPLTSPPATTPPGR